MLIQLLESNCYSQQAKFSPVVKNHITNVIITFLMLLLDTC